MRCLITGMTGLVGSVLRKELLYQGHEIHFLTTRKSQCTAFEHCTGFFWDPTSAEIDAKCYEGVDVIFHLAGASIAQRWTKKNKAAILNSRVQGTRLLVEGLSQLDQHQVKQVVCASAIGVYPSSENTLYTEDYRGKPNSFLEKVVLDWEYEEQGFTSLGLSTSILRIGLVLTATGGVLGPMKIPTSLGLGAAFGHGRQVQSWIHVNDLVRMMLFAAENQWRGVFNAVSPHPVSQKQFVSTLATALGRPFFLPAIPRWLIQLFAGEMSVLVFNSQHVSAQKAVDHQFTFDYPDLLPAMESLLSVQESD